MIWILPNTPEEFLEKLLQRYSNGEHGIETHGGGGIAGEWRPLSSHRAYGRTCKRDNYEAEIEALN